MGRGSAEWGRKSRNGVRKCGVEGGRGEGGMGVGGRGEGAGAKPAKVFGRVQQSASVLQQTVYKKIGYTSRFVRVILAQGPC